MTTKKQNDSVRAKLNANVDAVLAAEGTTRKVLASLSRELIPYVLKTNDIDIINRLISGLTPANKKVATLFFKHFMPWQKEEDLTGAFSRFSSRIKGDNRIKKYLDRCQEFLADEKNNIWTWAGENVIVDKKPVDLSDGIKKSLTKALKGVDTKTQKAEALSLDNVVASILDVVSLDDLMDTLTKSDSQEAA